MNLLRQLKIGPRLGLGFGILMLALLATSGVGLMNATRSMDLGAELTANNSSTVALSEAQSAVWALRWGVAQFIAVTSESDRKQIVEAQDKLRKQFEAAMRAYTPNATTPEETALLKELNVAFEKYVTARSRWFELYGSGKMEEAAQFRAEHLTPAGGATNKALASLIPLQQKIATAHQERAAEATKSGRTVLGTISGIALLLAVTLSWLVSRSITKPLAQTVACARRVADGDLASPPTPEGRDEVTDLTVALKDMDASLSDLVTRIGSGTAQITVSSQQIASGNADLSQRTEEQASSLEETASSMEELTSTVKQSADNARQANQLALGASAIAVKGGQVVGEVVSTMSGISESSKKIADIIGVIDGIAFQTNILALNAAVEAARAGEQGRGFAVVASEVRTLAQRSAAAAKEIKELITDSVYKVEGGTKLVGEAGKTMEEIVTAVKRVTDIMTEITAAAQEQSSGIEQVNQAVMQMDQVTQQNAALVEEAAAAADSMQQQAQALSKTVSVFKVAHVAKATPATTDVEPKLSQAEAGRGERRGPNRAKNVARLQQKPVATAEQKAHSEHAKTGTNDEWSEF